MVLISSRSGHRISGRGGRGGEGAAWVVFSVGESEAEMVRFGAGTSRGSRAAGTRLARPVGGLTRPEPSSVNTERERCSQDIVPPHKYLFIFV